MTGSERQQLRALIDQRRRELEHDDQPRCAGCGCLHDDRSAGCRPCTDRHLRRKWRQDPVKLERMRRVDRARKARRRHKVAA